MIEKLDPTEAISHRPSTLLDKINEIIDLLREPDSLWEEAAKMSSDTPESESGE